MDKPTIESTHQEWDIWAKQLGIYLGEKGYKKTFSKYQTEDWASWKTFEKYQIGVLFYDFRKYKHDPMSNRIDITYVCILSNNETYTRFDLTVMKDITIDEFEEIAQNFYDSMKKFV